MTELVYPITVDGKEIKEVELRRPKVRDLKAAAKIGKDAMEQETLLIANLAGLPVDAVEEMDLADYTALQEKLKSFLS